MKQQILVLLLISFCFATQNTPWFCHELECPPFQHVNHTTSTYEIRKYNQNYWVSTNEQTASFEQALKICFYRLFSYIDGENEQKIKIPMTAPVRMKIESFKNQSFAKTNFSESFYLPFKYQPWSREHARVPNPIDPQVVMEKSEQERFAVLSFGGFVNDQKVVQYASILRDALDVDKIKYDNSHYFYAGYDPPYRLVSRHNEIWIKLI